MGISCWLSYWFTLASNRESCLFSNWFSLTSNRESSSFSNWFSLAFNREARLFWWFVTDCLVLLPQPSPFVNFQVSFRDIMGGAPVVYQSDTILLGIMLVLRAYLLPRFLADNSPLRLNELTYRMARFHNVDVSTW